MSYGEQTRNPHASTHEGEIACSRCGEVAVIGLLLQRHAHEVPFCGACADQVEECPSCQQMFWGPDGQRILGNRHHCPVCAAKHPAVVGEVMAGIAADEQQDEFNRTRR